MWESPQRLYSMIFGVLVRILVWTMPPKPVYTSVEENVSLDYDLNFSFVGALPHAVRLDLWTMINAYTCEKDNPLINLNSKFPGNVNVIRDSVRKALPSLESKCQALAENFQSIGSGSIYRHINELRNTYPSLSFAHFSSSAALLKEIPRFSNREWLAFLDDAKSRISYSPLYAFQTHCQVEGAFLQLISVLFFEK